MTLLPMTDYARLIPPSIKWYSDNFNLGKEEPFHIKVRDVLVSELKAIDIYYPNSTFFKRNLIYLHQGIFKMPDPPMAEEQYDILCNLGNPTGKAYNKALLFIEIKDDKPSDFNNTIINNDDCFPDSYKPANKKPISLL